MYTDWQGSPARRIVVHHGSKPPQLILAQRPSSLRADNVVVGRFLDDQLTIYVGDDRWLNEQTGIN